MNRGFNTKLIDLIDFKEQNLKNQKYVIFITSTHGDGGPPENATRLYQYLVEKPKTQNYLKGVKFSCFCLGDSAYKDTYNAFGK